MERQKLRQQCIYKYILVAVATLTSMTTSNKSANAQHSCSTCRLTLTKANPKKTEMEVRT